MARLRAPDGCPWDRKQTPKSLAPYLLEETYEVLEAIDRGDPAHLREELGDVLFQIVFHARIGAEEGTFTIDDVIAEIRDKMIRRHPHVFGAARCSTPEQVVDQWAEIKKQEGKVRESRLDGVPRALPALLRAERLQGRAADVGFDWDRVGDAVVKLREEFEEWITGSENENADEIEEELGDFLFMCVNVARFLRVSPEEALRRANAKFESRFHHIERRAVEQGRDLREMSLEEMDALWDEAKELERGS